MFKYYIFSDMHNHDFNQLYFFFWGVLNSEGEMSVKN